MAKQADELIDITDEIRRALELARDALSDCMSFTRPTSKDYKALDAVNEILAKLNPPTR